MPRPQLIVMVSGIFLILAGAGLVIAQVVIQASAPDVRFPTRSLDISVGGARAALGTTYVGLVMIVTGAVLEIVGYVAPGRPKQPSAREDDSSRENGS